MKRGAKRNGKTPAKSAVPRRQADGSQGAAEAAAWLSAIVDNSDDAILSKTLDGVITTWNAGAERLFGYSAAEAVGQPVTILVPEDRFHEEADILRRLRAGERIDHFETVRCRKNGDCLDVSLTVSPVRNEEGAIIGASKIARDITEQKRAFAQQAVLLREMNHRIKNLFSVTASLVALSARHFEDGDTLARDLEARLHALARAHALTMPDPDGAMGAATSTTLVPLLEAILAPYNDAAGSRISISGCDAPLAGTALTSMALVLHELATNAAKHGALGAPDGRLTIHLSTEERLRMTWVETNVPHSPSDCPPEGFGATLERAALRGIGASIRREWKEDGLAITLDLPLGQVAP